MAKSKKEPKEKKGLIAKAKEAFGIDSDQMDESSHEVSQTATAQQSSSRKKGEGLEAFRARIREKAARAKNAKIKSQFQ